MIFAAVFTNPREFPLAVEFQLTDIEYKPLADQQVRLVLGERVDWQDPSAGHRLTTAADGTARLTTRVTMDKCWQWVNIGFTPFSKLQRTLHLAVRAELPEVIPGAEGSPDRTVPVLHRMDIHVRPHGPCSTVGFIAKYTRDGAGRFTERVPSGGMPLPELGGLVLAGDAYQPSDFLLEREESPSQGWKLKLAFKRLPRPVRY